MNGRTPKNEKGIGAESVEELLELMALGEVLKKLDMGKIAEEKLNRLTEKNRVVHDLLAGNKVVDRRLKQATSPKKRKKLHWKTKEKTRKDYYKKVVVPKNRERKARLLGEHGWYGVLAAQWKRAKVEVELTEDQWNEHIKPKLGEATPSVSRYDPAAPISLYNVCIRTRLGTVFDGVEYKMKELGYIQ